MAIGTTAAVLLGLGAAGAGVAASKIMSGASNKIPSAPAALPQPPDPGVSAEKGAETARRKKAGVTQTVFNPSPLGIAGEADVARKTLLGQ
jgi:hypothetical protein